ncbi:transporter substrate-binding domain-containing protein [Pseudodesulfovibrio thermohalotolerans]|uniref:transporter substrate-binding domain-containing protein n=1 Tax=Pseudodesulfovibrio thermohalotolerans TaxID=2880651 RepID=UPI002441AD78|nr:transporter substrate-binding domain-containing protein [Pseudodesulfovibrio thermohalotolerans]WFS62952.1 transporter substrate-binding domain-containing protein [Pseudodesulfovibrio thermohalotolerans]
MRAVLRYTLTRLRLMCGNAALAAACVALCLLAAATGHAREPYRIGFSPDAMVHVKARERLEAVYRRAGLPVEFVSLPTKRSLVLASDGILDGDAGRIPNLEKNYPSLIRVNVPLLELIGTAYVLKKREMERFDKSLLDEMTVGAVRGVLWAERVMAGRPLVLVNNYETLFNMLLEGRIDIALGSRSSAEKAFREQAGRFDGIRGLSPSAFRTPFYHYLHEKNARIVPRLEKALRELRAEGR